MKRPKKSKKGGAWYNPWKSMSKTLKTRINDYIYKNDICCEKEINRLMIIQMIMDHYKKKSSNDKDMDPNEYLNWLTNDLVGFIGYRNTLEKENKEGLELWDEIDKETSKNKKSDKKSDRGNIVTFLKKVPLYFLLAFLGYSDYVEKVSQQGMAANQARQAPQMAPSPSESPAIR
jgi:hypothetical protein